MKSITAQESEDSLYETLPLETRIRIRERFDYHCGYCGWKMGKHLTIDHIVPRSSGGSHTEDNLFPCCPTCNEAKGDHSLEVFRLILQQGPRGWQFRWGKPFVRRLLARFPDAPRKLWFEREGP